MEHPLVTVIIPAYNHERYVEEAFLSVLNQTYDNMEVIVIDDGSTDSTPRIIEDVLKRLKPANATFISQKNAGIAGTLNRGIRLSKGEFIAILASDDVFLPERIEEGVKAFLKAGPDVVAVYSDGFIIDAEGKKLRRFSEKYIVPLGKNTYKELLIGNWIPAMGILYRKEELLRIGLFDEDLRVEDYDLLLRLTKDRGILYIPKQLFMYRWHGENLSVAKDMMRRQKVAVARKHPDLESYQRFKSSLSALSLSGIARSLSLLNVELLARELLRSLRRMTGAGYGRSTG